MKSSIVRKEIHDCIDRAGQKFLASVYSMIQAEKESNLDSEDYLRAEMIRRAEASEPDVEAGRTVSAKEFKLRIEDWKVKKRAGIK